MTISVAEALALCACLAASAVAAQQPIVKLNGQPVAFSQAQPHEVDGVMMIPVRPILEQLGGQSIWDSGTGTLTIKLKGSVATLRIGALAAQVDGREKTLGHPLVVENGAVLVPATLFHHLLALDALWNPAKHVLSIQSRSAASAHALMNQGAILRHGEILPVTLDTALNSASNHVGDTFTATLDTGESNEYAHLPHGTRVEGHVAAVWAKSGGKPGMLDLAFDRIDLPTGASIAFNASSASLDSPQATEKDGIYRSANAKRRGRMVFIGYGSPQVRLVEIETPQLNAPENVAKAMKEVRAAVPPGDRKAQNVALSYGTRIGVRLDSDLTILPRK